MWITQRTPHAEDSLLSSSVSDPCFVAAGEQPLSSAKESFPSNNNTSREGQPGIYGCCQYGQSDVHLGAGWWDSLILHLRIPAQAGEARNSLPAQSVLFYASSTHFEKLFAADVAFLLLTTSDCSFIAWYSANEQHTLVLSGHGHLFPFLVSFLHSRVSGYFSPLEFVYIPNSLLEAAKDKVNLGGTSVAAVIFLPNLRTSLILSQNKTQIVLQWLIISIATNFW